MLAVYLPTYAGQSAPLVGRGFKGQANAYDFERVCEENGDHARKAAGNEAAARCLLRAIGDDGRSYLVVGKEFYAGVGEDAEEGSRVAFEQTADAVLGVDVAQGKMQTGPAASVFDEGGVAGLQKDLDAVERTDDGFALQALVQRMFVLGWQRGVRRVRHVRTAHPASPPARPLFSMYSRLRLSSLLSCAGCASSSVASVGGAFCSFWCGANDWAEPVMMREA